MLFAIINHKSRRNMTRRNIDLIKTKKLKDEIEIVIQKRLNEIKGNVENWQKEYGRLSEVTRKRLEIYTLILEKSLFEQKQKLKEISPTLDSWERTKQELDELSNEIELLYEKIAKHFQSTNERR
jgi:hypothetical protein